MMMSTGTAGEGDVRNSNSGGYHPFTASQWQELEQQALVYKYIISGMPIPPDLLFTIKTSLDSCTDLILHHQLPHHDSCAAVVAVETEEIKEALQLVNNVC